MNDKTVEFVDQLWRDSIVPTLEEYIRIPNKSPHFDPDWAAHGFMDQATELLAGWAREHAVEGMQLEVVRLPGRTPLIFIEVDGSTDESVLLYGHLDKQPEMSGWDDGKGPWEPVLEGTRLYGRGGADDGYALFSALTAIAALQRDGRPHARCVILIEACEESGSFDLPAYLEHLDARIGTPSFIVCLDSGCGNYDQLWVTTSLRGNVTGTLQVEVLEEGIHSGNGGGIVPETFSILRTLLDRIEDSATGRILVPELHADIPEARAEQARAAAGVLGNAVFDQFPFVKGARAQFTDAADAVLQRTWRPALAITGADGLPAVADAGNVLRPSTTLKLSVRTPPTVSTAEAAEHLRRVLEADPPHGARITFRPGGPGDGWEAPATAPWVEESARAASERHFGAPAMWMGEGVSIPFMSMLGLRYPAAQFLITGVLGPGSNAHGPNEFLEVDFASRLTRCVADVLEAHARADHV